MQGRRPLSFTRQSSSSALPTRNEENCHVLLWLIRTGGQIPRQRGLTDYDDGAKYLGICARGLTDYDDGAKYLGTCARGLTDYDDGEKYLGTCARGLSDYDDGAKYLGTCPRGITE